MLWKIDTERSHIDFVARKFMLQPLHGRFTDFTGEITYNPLYPHHSTIHISIDPHSFKTNVMKRDNGLKRYLFNTNSMISFNSGRIRLRDEATAEVSGCLTVNTIVHPIKLDVEFLGYVDDAMQFRGMTVLKRKDFNIRLPYLADLLGLLINDQVEVSMHIQAVRVHEYAWT